MYAEPGFLLSFSQGRPQEPSPAMALRHHPPPPPTNTTTTHGDLLRRFQTSLSCGAAHLGNLVHNSTIIEYDLGGEGDLFKAPEPIIEEPALELDPMADAISMISVGENVVTAEPMKVADLESIADGHILSEVFYECRKDLLASSAINDSVSGLPDVKLPVVQMDKNLLNEKNRLPDEGLMQKSVSSGCLSSIEWINSCPMKPTFLDFQGMDLEAALGLRRAYSESDIQTLGTKNSNIADTSIICCSLTTGDCKIEERKEKLLRYREKKSKRNFCRKIKYACRKALADSQPRVRGRFAKTE